MADKRFRIVLEVVFQLLGVGEPVLPRLYAHRSLASPDQGI
jgi:hypothetical protein